MPHFGWKFVTFLLLFSCKRDMFNFKLLQMNLLYLVRYFVLKYAGKILMVKTQNKSSSLSFSVYFVRRWKLLFYFELLSIYFELVHLVWPGKGKVSFSHSSVSKKSGVDIVPSIEYHYKKYNKKRLY